MEIESNDPAAAAASAPPSAQRRLELLAPAGDRATLDAALAAGADAVYFGLTVLNARRRARNFTEQELADAVCAAHERGARAYLTLNTDLSERELVTAARVLELARGSGCDGVLVRDPALLALRGEYPELSFHFSTQTSMASSADVEAAVRLGANRVVLARELSLPEIAAASAVPGIETEVFVQGALCFSVSGRCLLSSWVGGRSANRGLCASPCRVPWSVGGAPVGTPLSMHDLSAVERLPELQAAGVTALKIEGRMKNAAWVQRAVGLYHRGLAGADSATLRGEAASLGAYSGRQVTSGYFDAERWGLMGLASRLSGCGDEEEETAAAEDAATEGASAFPAEPARATFDFSMTVAARGIECCCRCRGQEETWTIPRTVVRRVHKAASIEQLFQFLASQPQHGYHLGSAATNEPDFLLVPHAVNGLVARITKTLQRWHKHYEPLGKIALPESVRAILEERVHAPTNRTPLGQSANRVRLEVDAVAGFLREVRPEAVLVEGLTAEQVRPLRSVCGRVALIAALPPVFFEADLPRWQALVSECHRAGLAVEVNSWGGWHLARQTRVRIEGGPGLAVLNSLAAQVLAKAGFQSVTLNPEADRRQLEEVSANCPVSCAAVVYGRPPLMISRAELPEEYLSQVLVDRRDVQVVPRREHGLWVLRPRDPYDLRGTTNERIRVRHLVVDLVGAEHPLREWLHGSPRNRPVLRFNYDRLLS